MPGFARKGDAVSEASDNEIDRWGLVACLLIALVLRGLVVGLCADELTHDRDAYLGIAQGFADGRGLSSPGSTVATAFRPPLYPLFLGGMMAAVPASLAVAFVNILFGMTTVWATHRVGRQLSLGRASLVAALLVAIDPLLLQYAAQPMTETVCTGLVALLLIAMAGDWWRGPCREWAIGLLFGLLVLCRPTFWPLAGLMVASWSVNCWRGWHNQKKDKNSDRSANQCDLPWRVAVGTLLVVVPWVVRNRNVFGVPLLTTTHGGYTLLLANNPVFYDEVVDQPWGTVWSGDSLARWQSDLDKRLGRDLGPRASEIERDRRQSVIAREFITAEPRRFARAAWHRVRSLWSTVPHGDATGGSSRWLIEVVGWYYSLILLAFAVGMMIVARRPDRGRWWVLYAVVITVQAVHLVYWTNARMRAPLMPVIALFAVAILAPRTKRQSSDSSSDASLGVGERPV